jgi:hypothetical protein
MFTSETQARLSALRQYLPKGYAEKVLEKARERGEKIGLTAVYKVAQGKAFNIVVFEEIVWLATQERKRVETAENQLAETLDFFEKRLRSGQSSVNSEQ